MRSGFGLSAITNRLGLSDFARDKAVVERTTGATLTPEQFETYKASFLLRKEFGDAGKLHRRYGGFGIPRETERVEIAADVLAKLYNANVVLDFGPRGSAFRQRLEQDVRAYATQQYSLPAFPKPYMEAQEVQHALEQLYSALPHLRADR